MTTCDIGAADTQERVDRAGGSSRITSGVGWLGGLADLCLGCRAWRGVAGGVLAAAWFPFRTDAFLGGAISIFA